MARIKLEEYDVIFNVYDTIRESSENSDAAHFCTMMCLMCWEARDSYRSRKLGGMAEWANRLGYAFCDKSDELEKK